MKNALRKLALTIAATITIGTANAQNGFIFSKSTQAYTKLSGTTTSLTKGKPWTSDSTFEAPLGFNFNMGGTVLNKVTISAGNYVGFGQGTKQSGFVLAGTGLMDRSILLGSARASHIRYQTTGTAPGRIFKLEVENAGFEDEYVENGELKDSISMQLWLYEGSNVAEFRYGNSAVNYFSTYFGAQMMCGFLKNMDTATLTLEKFYLAHGTPSTASLDSTTTFLGTKGLNAVPPSGTVFRFALKGSGANGITKVAAGTLAEVYPTQCAGTLFISNTKSAALNYTVSDMWGRIIANGIAANGKSAVDVSRAAAGVYSVRLFDERSGTFEAQQFTKL